MKEAQPTAPVERMRPITVRIPEACRITGIGRSKIYELIQSGDLATIKIGTMTLIPVASIEALLGTSQSPATRPN